MKFGVVVFPGSNCERDIIDALRNDLKQEVIELWHKDRDLSMFFTEDCIVLPGGFSYGDYLRCGAIAKFSPMMQSVIEFANSGGKVLGMHILGPGAAEMIQMAAIAMGMSATKADFDRAIAMHPTAGEELVTFKGPSYRYRGGRKV